MKRILLIAALGLLAGASCAQAHTTIIEPMGSHFPYQRWVDEAKMPTPDVALELIEAPCPDQSFIPAACTALNQPTLWMDVQALYQQPSWPKEVFYHELGHAFDVYASTDSLRKRFRALRGSKAPWGGAEGLGEVFAESYMSCALDLPAYFANTQAAYSEKACRLIKRVG